MADVVTFDPINLRIIEINTGLANVEIDWLEIYSEWKDWLRADASRMGYPQAFRVVGGDPISGSANLGSTFFMLYPWKFRPAEYNHRLTLVGNMFSDPAGESVVATTLGTFTVLVEQRVSNLTDAVFAEAPEVQFASYGDVVSVDAGSVNSGTEYPVGTKRFPVNNMADALAIAAARGLPTFSLQTNLTLAGVNASGYSFVGLNHNIVLTVDGSANTTDCGFSNLTLQGTLSGPAHIRDCYVEDISNAHGHITESLLNGTITLSGAGLMHIAKCQDGLTGLGTPVIDCAGTGSDLLVTGYFGGLTLRNKTGTEEVSVNVSSARIVLENTVTNGTIIVRGTGQLDDSSVGATVDSSGLMNPTAPWDVVLASPVTGSTGATLNRSALKAALAAALAAASG